MAKESIKALAHMLIDELPEDATWADLARQAEVQASVDAVFGLVRASEAGGEPAAAPPGVRRQRVRVLN